MLLHILWNAKKYFPNKIHQKCNKNLNNRKSNVPLRLPLHIIHNSYFLAFFIDFFEVAQFFAFENILCFIVNIEAQLRKIISVNNLKIKGKITILLNKYICIHTQIHQDSL